MRQDRSFFPDTWHTFVTVPGTTFGRHLRARPSVLSDPLEVAEGIDGRAVDAHLEMEMRAEGVPGGADLAEHFALADLLAVRDVDPLLVPVGRRDAAAVVDDHEVAVAAHPAGVDDRAARGCPDRCPGADTDVDALVHAAPAIAERARDRPVDRPDEAARRGRTGSRGGSA